MLFFQRSLNITFDTVTPLNEAVSKWWVYGKAQEGCHFDRDKQSLILQRLEARLIALNGTHTRAHGAEENSIDDSLESMQAYPPGVEANLGLLTTHTYNGNNRAGLAAYARTRGQRLWNSEFGTGSGPLQGGLQLAQQIIVDVQTLNVTAWTLWQAADLDNALSPQGWGLLATSYVEPQGMALVSGTPTSRQCLTDTTGLMADGDRLGLATCTPSTATALQQWSFNAGGTVTLVNASGLCLDDWGRQLQAGDAVRLYSCWGGTNQAWSLTANNTVSLLPGVGLCLEATGPNNITAQKCDPELSTQKWYPLVLRPAIYKKESVRRAPMCNTTHPFSSRWHHCHQPAPRHVATSEKFVIRKQYYAYKQFTSFLRPGSIILPTTDLNTLAALVSPTTLAVVVVNPSNSESSTKTFSLLGTTLSLTIAPVINMTDAQHNCMAPNGTAVITVLSPVLFSVAAPPESILTVVLAFGT